MRRWAGLLVLIGVLLASCGAPATLTDPLVDAAERRAAQAATALPATPDGEEDPESSGSSTTLTPTTTVASYTSSSTPATTSSTSTTSTSTTTTTVAADDQADDEPFVCQSEAVGLSMVVPADWTCERVTTPVVGGTAFSASSPNGSLTITLGVGAHTFACELFDVCGQAPVELTELFPDTSIFRAGGITEISGNYIDGEAYVVAASNQDLAQSDLDLIAEIMDSVSS